MAGKNRNVTHPSIGSWVARLRGESRRDLPRYVAIPHDAQLGIRVRYATAGLLGSAYEPVFSGMPPDTRRAGTIRRATCGWTRRSARPGSTTGWRCCNRWTSNPRLAAACRRSKPITARPTRCWPATRPAAAFDLARESAKLRHAYGDHLWGQQTILARRLAESGVPFTLVNYTLTQHHGQDWDTHVDNFGQMRKVLLPPMDRAVSTLLDDLEDRGLLDTTLVAMFGEFGRTPQINAQGGRDHWDQVCSVMLAGGGLKRGVVVGSSTRAGDVPLDRPIHFNDVLATIYRQLGIPTDCAVPRSTRPPDSRAGPRRTDSRAARVGNATGSGTWTGESNSPAASGCQPQPSPAGLSWLAVYLHGRSKRRLPALDCPKSSRKRLGSIRGGCRSPTT